MTAADHADLLVAVDLAAPLTGALVGLVVLVAGVGLRGRRRSRPRMPTAHGAPAGSRPPSKRAADRQHAMRRLAATAVVAVVAGPLPAAVMLVAAAVLPGWRRARAAARDRRAVIAAYPDAIDLVVLGVRAGMLPGAAAAAAADYMPLPVRQAFLAVTRRVDGGERFADALGELESHVGQLARPLIDSFAAAERYGLPLAPVLERLAAEARQQRRRAAETAARQLPVRLSLPLVLCTLPSFVLLAIVPLLLGAFSSLHAQ